jgi:hypothetical protein
MKTIFNIAQLAFNALALGALTAVFYLSLIIS